MEGINPKIALPTVHLELHRSKLWLTKHDRIESSLTSVTSYSDQCSTKPSTKVSPEQVWSSVMKYFPLN